MTEDLVVAVIFLVLSVLFFCGIGSNLLAGYNTMSEGKKSKYNKKAVCRAAGLLFAIVSAGLFLLAFFEKIDFQYLKTAETVIKVISITAAVVTVLLVNTNKHFITDN